MTARFEKMRPKGHMSTLELSDKIGCARSRVVLHIKKKKLGAEKNTGGYWIAHNEAERYASQYPAKRNKRLQKKTQENKYGVNFCPNCGFPHRDVVVALEALKGM
jgi:ribosomal protein L32